jgi:hypothetical protein
VDEFEVVPLVGAAPVLLGMPREEVWRVMPGERDAYHQGPFATHETDFWTERGVQAFYTGNPPVVVYIQFVGKIVAQAGSRVIIAGLSVFDTPAEEVVAHVSKLAPFDPNDRELGYTYIFPDLELSLWRPVKSGEEARVFHSLGIGARGYFSKGT